MVTLSAMTVAEFKPYIHMLLESYAADHVAAGNWDKGEALSKATEQTNKLMPEGVATSGHSLFIVESNTNSERVGVLWVAEQNRGGKKSLWIYDVEIDEPFRQQGYGSAAFVALEKFAKERGVEEISLHVFGSNTAARAMYTKLGFGEVDVVMSKSL